MTDATRTAGAEAEPEAAGRIPAHGWSREQVLGALEGMKAHDMPWRDGRTWAYVYDPGPAAEEVIKAAFSMYLTENALDPTVFPSTLALENELVAMAAAHLRGDAEVVGSFTSGGTESILLAVKAARDRARALRPEIREPELVLPATAHAAFQKACHYLDVRPVLVPVDPKSFRADVGAMRDAIGPNTIQLVGSAVSYAHGVVDPIEALGELALERDLLLHVDACMGGFLLPYFRRLGAPVPRFELDVPGVTSISMDLHKYAFAAKGASVLLHRSPELRRYQMYACSNWTGYTVINPTVQSTKSGGPLAAAWAVLHFLGDDGYLEIARQVLDATRRIADWIDASPDLRLLGRPEMNLVAFTSDTVSVFHVADEMKARGWYVQPQLGYGDSPENLHLSINPASVRWVDALLADLAGCLEQARSLPSGALAERIREAFGALDPDSLTPDAVRGLLGMAGVAGTSLPGRMAEINEVLNALPVALRERLLIEYLNELYRQPERSRSGPPPGART
jgi:sphinganine-1-phosphate aldolase